MQINIPAPEQQRLTEQAKAAGYDDVERYVTEHVMALAHHPTSAELQPLSDDELQASLAACDRSMTEFSEGKGLSVKAARQLTQERLSRESQ